MEVLDLALKAAKGSQKEKINLKLTKTKVLESQAGTSSLKTQRTDVETEVYIGSKFSQMCHV